MDHMNWRKSSYSSDNGGECVEVASPEGAVAVRDTKQNGTGGPVLRFSPAAWRRFASRVKRSLASGRLLGQEAVAPDRVRITRSVRPDSGPWGGGGQLCARPATHSWAQGASAIWMIRTMTMTIAITM
jgi:uncharacterized protein DUF397